jgi:hypothetical protein
VADSLCLCALRLHPDAVQNGRGFLSDALPAAWPESRLRPQDHRGWPHRHCAESRKCDNTHTPRRSICNCRLPKTYRQWHSWEPSARSRYAHGDSFPRTSYTCLSTRIDMLWIFWVVSVVHLFGLTDMRILVRSLVPTGALWLRGVFEELHHEAPRPRQNVSQR